MTWLAGLLIIVALLGLIFVAVAWRRTLPIRLASTLPWIFAAVFLFFNLTDWPLGLLADFWRDHPVVTASVGAIYLVVIVFFGFEHRERQRQDKLDQDVTAVARTGMVDHLVDLDVALSLLFASREALEERWPNWNGPDRPLRWLRSDRREHLGTNDHVPKEDDPRAVVSEDPIARDAWRADLFDQMVRRLMAGIKEWGAILASSEIGQEDLIDLAQIRQELISLRDDLRFRNLNADDVDKLRQRCRREAWSFEERGVEVREGQPIGYRVELIKPSS